MSARVTVEYLHAGTIDAHPVVTSKVGRWLGDYGSTEVRPNAENCKQCNGESK